MTLYRAAQAAAASTVAAVFAEPFTLRPMKQTAGRWAVDPDRDEVDLVAVFTDVSEVLDQIGERNASGMSKGVASQSATSRATIDYKISAVPYQVVAGDRFIREATGEVFEVKASPQTDISNAVARVVKLGVAA